MNYLVWANSYSWKVDLRFLGAEVMGDGKLLLNGYRVPVWSHLKYIFIIFDLLNRGFMFTLLN